MTEPEISKTQLRIETDLWKRVEAVARRRRLSNNAFVCNAVEAAVLQAEKEDRESGRLGGAYQVNPHTASVCADQD